MGEPLPTVTDEYNKETGAPEKQCTNEGKSCTEGKPKTITSVYNKLGQLENYTDADENTTTYEYEKEKGARLKTVNDKEGTESFGYSETSGLLDELTYTNGTHQNDLQCDVRHRREHAHRKLPQRHDRHLHL